MRELQLQDLLDEYKPERSGQPLVVTRFPCVIGRHSECDVQLPHPAVSRRQCEIFLRREEAWIRDLDSRNGTFLNNERLQAPQPLRDGDLIEFSWAAFRVRLPAERGSCRLEQEVALAEKR
jgi:pSer/pThr/pTyr-binding forkhead associated (FHA) protein